MEHMEASRLRPRHVLEQTLWASFLCDMLCNNKQSLDMEDPYTVLKSLFLRPCTRLPTRDRRLRNTALRKIKLFSTQPGISIPEARLRDANHPCLQQCRARQDAAQSVSKSQTYFSPPICLNVKDASSSGILMGLVPLPAAAASERS
jgi:hypothetical protein